MTIVRRGYGVGGVHVSWFSLLPAIVLLFFPMQVLLPKSTVFRVYEQIPPRGKGRFPWWWTPAVWLEPLLGLGGAYLLHEFTFAVEPDATGLTALLPALTTFVILLIALVLRMPVWRDRRACVAPLGFLVGVAFGLMPPLCVVVGLLLAVCAMGGFQHFGAAFLAGAPALGAAGLLFKAPRVEVALAAVLLIVPFVFSVATYRVMTFPSRR